MISFIMNTATFDTYAHINILKREGMTETQAVAVVNMVKEVQENTNSNLVTKADLAAGLAELKAEIIKYMFTGFIAIIGLLAAILFKLH